MNYYSSFDLLQLFKNIKPVSACRPCKNRQWAILGLQVLAAGHCLTGMDGFFVSMEKDGLEAELLPESTHKPHLDACGEDSRAAHTQFCANQHPRALWAQIMASSQNPALLNYKDTLG